VARSSPVNLPEISGTYTATPLCGAKGRGRDEPAVVFPIIPVIAATAIVMGSVALVWYSNLTAEEKERADIRANELAQERFGEALDKLSKFNFMRVLLAVKREITGKDDDDPLGA
jgi:hypothetical protein